MSAPADARLQPSVSAPRLLIVGGGVSGMAAAAAARQQADRAGAALHVLVLERGARVGGRAHSVRQDGWLVEAGPSGYLDTDPEFAALVAAAGLQERRLVAARAAARRFVFWRGRLHALGGNPLAPIRSGLIGPAALARLLAEPLLPARRDGAEESVAAFVRRRFGRAVAERIAATAVLGIFAGDAELLSVDACFPELRRLEIEHGSVLRGALARRRARGAGPAAAAAPSGRLTSFPDGLQELPLALARTPGIDVRTGVEVEEVTALADGSFRVRLAGGQQIAADAVLIATPVRTTARLLRTLAPAASEQIGRIETPPVAVVALGYDRPLPLPEGFGVLVARGEGIRMLGCLWESQIYPGRAPEGGALLRVMFGGRVDPEACALEDERLLALARAELARALGVRASPVRTRIFRWPHAIPQYELGHRALCDRVRRELARVPGLWLAGDALEGVSYVKTAVCGLRRGRAAAESLLRVAPAPAPPPRRREASAAGAAGGSAGAPGPTG